MSKWVEVLTITEDFDGRFWAEKTVEFRGWFPPPYRPDVPQPMGPFHTKEEAQRALAYLRDGPKEHERSERVV